MSDAEGIPKPVWLRRRLSAGGSSQQVRDTLRALGLHTVCQEAHCPNQAECFGRGTATFMILGDRCTRYCTFCAVGRQPREAPDPHEPRRLAEAVARLGLTYVVITSVTRDDLADGGASHFAATVRAVRAVRPEAAVELLIPDFQGSDRALQVVLEAGPAVLNHNVETVPRLYPAVRPQAEYRRSLQLLAAAKTLNPRIITKSGLMVGLGEQPGEVRALLGDLRQAGCDLLTIGQYLRPSREHHPVMEYVHPRQLQAYAREAGELGFLGVASGPYVRSSYQAADLYRQALGSAKD
jgi:lipoic acid synthetase